MERSKIIEELAKIKIIDDHYSKNILYKNFIDAKEQYEKPVPSLTKKKEMEFLLTMINSTYQDGAKFFDKNNTYLNKFLIKEKLLARAEVIQQPVIKILHFICLGKIENIQLEYINQWVQKNTDYKIKIWTDDTTYLARKLFVLIQERVTKEILNDPEKKYDDLYSTVKQRIIQWQNKAYQYIKDHPWHTFDQAVLMFLIEHHFGTLKDFAHIDILHDQIFSDALAQLKQNNPNATISLDYMNNTGHQIEENQIYIKELALRGNIAAAADLFRLLVLRKEGGICLHTNILPEVNKNLFRNIIEKTSIDPQGVRDQATIVKLILDQQTEQNKMPARASLMESYQWAPINPQKKQQIEKLITQTENEYTPLFMSLGEIKVDPYFQCSYTNGNSQVLVAEKGSLFINAMLIHLKKAHQIIDNEQHNINGLSKTLTLPEKISPELAKILPKKTFGLNAEALISYRHDIMSRYDQANLELTGIRAYDNVYFQLLSDIGIRIFKYDMPYKFQDLVSPRFIQASFLTEEYDQSCLQGMQRYLNVFTRTPQYYALYIVQLFDNDPVSRAAAQYLYHQNTELTAWYCYDKSNNGLKIVKEATADLYLKHETHFILVGNGHAFTFSGKTIAGILGRKSSNGRYDRVKRERITFLGCGLNQILPVNSPKQGELTAGFIKQLYHALKSKFVVVNSIVVQENLFTVDMMGNGWSGKLSPPSGRSATKIVWTRAGKEETKIKFTQQGDAIQYQYQSIEQGVARRTRTMTIFDQESFSLNDRIQRSSVNLTEKKDWLTESSEKLDGLIDEDIAKNIKAGALLHAPLLINSETIALIAGMSEGSGEILVVDSDSSKIAILMQILEQILEKKTYEDWFSSLALTCGRKKLQSLILKLFSDPQTAFLQLKRRVLYNQFTFYQGNITDNPTRILQGKYCSQRINGIYLGNMDKLIFSKNMEGDNTQSKLNKVITILEQFDSAINTLSQNNIIPIYYYSFFQRQYEHEQANSKNTYFIKHYANISYVQKNENFNFVNIHPNLHAISRFNGRMRIKSLQFSLNEQNQSLNKEWVGILKGIKYNPISEKYILPLINTENFTDLDEIEVDDNFFEELRQYLDPETGSIDQYHQFAKGRVRPKLVGKIGGIGGMGTIKDSILSLYDAIKYGPNQIAGDSVLAKTVQAHVYLSLTADATNVLNTLGTTGELSLQGIAKVLKNSGHFSRTATTLGKYNTKLGKGNVFISAVSLGFNTLELILAENETQRSMAITRSAFDIAAIALGIVGLIFTSPFAVVALFVVGIALAIASAFISSEVEIALENIEKAKSTGRYFNNMRKGWLQGGFYLVKGTLVPYPGTVITEINFIANENKFVTFSHQGQQMLKMADTATPIAPPAYVNLRELNGTGITQQIIALQELGNQRIILVLPTAPQATITPLYDSVWFVQHRDDAEFETERFFARQKNSGFIFEENGKAITDLKFDYQYTEIKIFLSQFQYSLISPGVGEHQRVSDNTYKKYLHYRLYAPKTGNASVLLVLNKAQADITIECENTEVQWNINANHLTGIQTSFGVTNEGYVQIYFDRLVDSRENKSTEDKITLTITHRYTTRPMLQLPEGLFVANLKELRLIPLRFDASMILDLAQQIDPQNTVKRYITESIQGFGEVAKYVNVKGFTPYPEEQSDDDCIYVFTQDTFLYTDNHQNTLFFNTQRKNVKLIFLNDEYAWYQGDLIMPTVNASGVVCHYENIIWVSEIETNRLIQVYLPLCHLPTVTKNSHQITRSPSTLTKATLLAPAILFEQQYVDSDQQINMKYMIDLSDPEEKMALTEITSFPLEIKEQLVQSHDLTTLRDFIKSNLTIDKGIFQQQPLNPWERTGKNIYALRNARTDTTISIGNKLVWALPNSLAVTGNIVANISDSIANNPFYLVTLAGVAKDAEKPTPNEEPILVNYFFWSVTVFKNDPKNGDRQFHALYVQKENDEAQLMKLEDFDLINSEVENIKNALITTKQGFIYQLTNNKNLTLSGINETFIENHQNWSISFAAYIKKIQRSSGEKNRLKIAHHLSILGLLESDKVPLLAWYDKDSGHFIMCKAELNQHLIFCGISDGLKGAWIMNNKGESNKEVGYVPVMNASLLPSLFIGSVLQHEDALPTINMLTLDEELGQGFVSAGIKKKEEMIEGDLKAVTSKGIAINISMASNNTFQITLFAVTTVFTDQYRSDQLNTALRSLCQGYTCDEMIIVELQNGKTGYYHSEKDILFIPTHKEYSYFGFDSNKTTAYFLSYDKKHLIQINRQGAVKRIDSQEYEYQREEDVVALDSRSAATLSGDAYLNIDVPNLVIATSAEQAEEASFSIDFALFNYPIIWLLHYGKGALLCNIPANIPPAEVKMSNCNGMLCVFINNTLVLIENVFEPQTEKDTDYHHKFKLVFSNQHSVSVSAMKEHYISTAGTANDGHIIIPVPLPTAE